MTELTNAQLHQIREALRISVEYLPDNEDLTTVNAALDIVTKLLEVPAKVEAAPVAAKAEYTPTHERKFGMVMSWGNIRHGGSFAIRWYDGNEFREESQFKTRKEANTFLRDNGAEILTRSDYANLSSRIQRRIYEAALKERQSK